MQQYTLVLLHHEQHQGGGWPQCGLGEGEGVVGAPGQQGVLWESMEVQIIKVKGYLVGLSRHPNLLWWGGGAGITDRLFVTRDWCFRCFG